VQSFPPDPLVTSPAPGASLSQHTQGPTLCANCGAALAGQYCSTCGQRVEPHSHSLWSFVAEAAEALTHADSSLWRTLGPLLCRPGFLTQQFLGGRRARYLPPVRLYLVLSFLFFLLVTITSPVTSRSAPAIASTALDMKSPRRNALDEHAPDEMSNDPQKLRASGGTLTGNIDAAAERERILDLCRASIAHLPGPDWLRQPFFRACVRTGADQNRELGRTFVHNLGRALFLLLPLLAALMVPLYRHPKRYYVDHMLLLVHNHACVFLVMSGFIMAVRWIPTGTSANLVTFALILYLLIYLYSSMRRVYGESRARTLIKFSALSVGYFICAACTVLLTGLYSAEML
jgi:hypothetical protein